AISPGVHRVLHSFPTRRSSDLDVDNVVVMSMRVKATDELSRALDNVAVLATSILPTWNGSTWVDQATRNPAWAYVDILAGNAARSEEHTSELQSRENLVCRLLL